MQQRSNTCSPDCMILLIMLVVATIPIASATYAGDRPLATAYKDEGRLQYIYSMGDSAYRGNLKSGESYRANFTLEMPEGAVIRFQRLYVYWAWSRLNQQALYPAFRLTDSREPENALELAKRYVDSKGVVSSYDFYSGTDVYPIPTLREGTNEWSITIHQVGPEESSVLIFGIAVIVVYENQDEPLRMIWVKEGCDLLFSSYGISPEMASSEMIFEGSIPSAEISRAELFLVAPSGGYSRDLAYEINSLRVNRLEEENTPPLMRTIFSILFPNYRGKEWMDVFSMDDATQIGFERKEIRPYLKREGNTVVVRDQGDYMQLVNAILSVTMGVDGR